MHSDLSSVTQPKRTRLMAFLVALTGLIVALAITGEAYAVIGRPLTPLSVAGVARRSVRRNAYNNYQNAYPQNPNPQNPPNPYPPNTYPQNPPNPYPPNAYPHP